ncbi:unnamed protein product [Choristocarpus tenellus]
MESGRELCDIRYRCCLVQKNLKNDLTFNPGLIAPGSNMLQLLVKAEIPDLTFVCTHCVPQAIQAAGPFMVTLGFFVILPILWQIPICLVTAEMTTTFQDHRGSIAWVSKAFGDQWGFVNAIWSLATSFLDNAMFPLIIADYLELVGIFRWVTIYVTIISLSYLTYRGSDVVARTEELIFGLTILPFLVMIGAGIFKMDWGAVLTVPSVGDVHWRLYIQIMFWTSTYWQKVASVGPDVKNCSQNFPRAILIATFMQAGINGFIHLVAAGATDPSHYSDWKPGYLRLAADSIAGGRWLGVWLMLTAAVANSGSYLSEMSVTSQTLAGMAEGALLPSSLKYKGRHGTHPWALVTIAAIIAASQPLDFDALVRVCNFVYTLQTFLELAAFFHLRRSMPDLCRPFCVPGGKLGAAVVVGLPCIMLAGVLATGNLSAAGTGSLFAIGSIIVAQAVFGRRGGSRTVCGGVGEETTLMTDANNEMMTTLLEAGNCSVQGGGVVEENVLGAPLFGT